jgi:Late exocytosis, associated with Golgi transport/Cytosolic domain of 10TM putative phosphate transporter
MKSYTYLYTEDYDQSRFNFWTNLTQAASGNNDDFTSNYVAPEDVSVDAVLTSIYLNSIAFVFLMCMYECLRRVLPSVYSSEVKRQYKMNLRRTETHDSADDSASPSRQFDSFGDDIDGKINSNNIQSNEKGNYKLDVDDLSHTHSNASSDGSGRLNQRSSMSLPNYGSLPEVISQNWISSVFMISWDTIRKYSGLDGYFFLRYIRMNLRICAVTCFWAWITLVPTYATGANAGQLGWYHLSVANVLRGSWRMWIPALFAYLFTGFIFFVMKQEYRHFLELRMEFLARGTSYIHPQHHYSLMIENIPHELRSEKALYDYFDQLFPGKVHSVSIVLNIPDLEAVRARCIRVCRRLEKSIAYYHANGKRATHNVGSPRISVLGIDMAPCDCYGGCCGTPNVAYVDNREAMTHRPQRGTHVDSISYYTYDLAETNKKLYTMQQRKAEMAFEGSNHVEADNWFTKLVVSAHEMADEIMIDSAEDNALRTTYSDVSAIPQGTAIPQAELMSTHTLYGSIGVGETPRTAQCSPYTSQSTRNVTPYPSQSTRNRSSEELAVPSDDDSLDIRKRASEEELLVSVSVFISISLLMSFHY